MPGGIDCLFVGLFAEITPVLWLVQGFREECDMKCDMVGWLTDSHFYFEICLRGWFVRQTLLDRSASLLL